MGAWGIVLRAWSELACCGLVLSVPVQTDPVADVFNWLYRPPALLQHAFVLPLTFVLCTACMYCLQYAAFEDDERVYLIMEFAAGVGAVTVTKTDIQI